MHIGKPLLFCQLLATRWKVKLSAANVNKYFFTSFQISRSFSPK